MFGKGAMMAEEKNRTSAKPKRKTLKLWSRLQVRMTISYVVVSVVSALVLELLLIVFFYVVLTPFIDQNFQDEARRTAQSYAQEAASQGGGVALNPHSTFQPGQPFSLVSPGGNVSYQGPGSEANSNAQQTGEFVLLLTPGGQILASSDPAHYPISTPVAQLLPQQQQFIHGALEAKSR
jgi:hypothetical protein